MVDQNQFRGFQCVALAVINQAQIDARGNPKKQELTLEMEEARTFLLGGTALWKESRDFWCRIAKVEPEYLEARIKKEAWYPTYLAYKENPSLIKRKISRHQINNENKKSFNRISEILLRNYMEEKEKPLTVKEKKHLVAELNRSAKLVIEAMNVRNKASWEEFNSNYEGEKLSIGQMYQKFLQYKESEKQAKKAKLKETKNAA